MKIHVPRPPRSAYNPNRKASALLRNQVEHMHLAERRLPERYRTQIYVNAIQTEGEVAEYIGQVTEAITRAHQDAQKKRAKPSLGRTKPQKTAKRKQNPAASEGKGGRAVASAVKVSAKKKTSKTTAK